MRICHLSLLFIDGIEQLNYREVAMNDFIKAALIRAIRTICQTAIAMIGTTVVMQDVDWMLVGSASLLAGILSILTSIATGLPEVEMEGEGNE